MKLIFKFKIFFSYSNNGIHKFFADAGLTSKMCRHRREIRLYKDDEDVRGCAGQDDINRSQPLSCRLSPRGPCIRGPKTLRSGKKFY